MSLPVRLTLMGDHADPRIFVWQPGAVRPHSNGVNTMVTVGGMDFGVVESLDAVLQLFDVPVAARRALRK